MVGELKELSITQAEELLDENFYSNSSFINNYFTNSEILMEEQLSELPNVIIIN